MPGTQLESRVRARQGNGHQGNTYEHLGASDALVLTSFRSAMVLLGIGRLFFVEDDAEEADDLV